MGGDLVEGHAGRDVVARHDLLHLRRSCLCRPCPCCAGMDAAENQMAREDAIVRDLHCWLMQLTRWLTGA